MQRTIPAGARQVLSAQGGRATERRKPVNNARGGHQVANGRFVRQGSTVASANGKIISSNVNKPHGSFCPTGGHQQSAYIFPQTVAEDEAHFEAGSQASLGMNPAEGQGWQVVGPRRKQQAQKPPPSRHEAKNSNRTPPAAPYAAKQAQRRAPAKPVSPAAPRAVTRPAPGPKPASPVAPRAVTRPAPAPKPAAPVASRVAPAPATRPAAKTAWQSPSPTALKAVSPAVPTSVAPAVPQGMNYKKVVVGLQPLTIEQQEVADLEAGIKASLESAATEEQIRGVLDVTPFDLTASAPPQGGNQQGVKEGPSQTQQGAHQARTAATATIAQQALKAAAATIAPARKPSAPAGGKEAAPTAAKPVLPPVKGIPNPAGTPGGSRISAWTPRRKNLEVDLVEEEALSHEDHLSDERRLKQRLARLGLRHIPAVGDGNCLFRAVSSALYGTEQYHPYVRRRAVQHMREHARGLFETREDFNAYLDRMAKQGVWADEPELEAICHTFGVPITVVTSSTGGRFHHMYVPPQRKLDGEILLSYIADVHYDSLRLVESPAGMDRGAPKAEVLARVEEEEKRYAEVAPGVGQLQQVGSCMPPRQRKGRCYS